jgi:general secretion pathway protein G
MNRTLRLNDKGLSLIELVIALAILALLASVVIPLSEVTVTRVKEIELRRSLRNIRSAIDEYKADYDLAVKKKTIRVMADATGYPEELTELIEGKDWGELYPYKKKYLRRLPLDPFDRYEYGWGLRSYVDDADSSIWGREDVYDIYSQSDAVALDGTYYSDW